MDHPLLHKPIPDSLHVRLNGVTQRVNTDYQLKRTRVIIDERAQGLVSNDKLEFYYAYEAELSLLEETTLTALQWEPEVTWCKFQRTDTGPAPDVFEKDANGNDIFTWARIHLGPPYLKSSNWYMKVTLLDDLPSAVDGVYDGWYARGVLRPYNSPSGNFNATEGGFYFGADPNVGTFVDYNMGIGSPGGGVPYPLDNFGMVWARYDNEYGRTNVDPVSSWNMDPLEWDAQAIGPLHGIQTAGGTPYFDGKHHAIEVATGNVRNGYQGWTSPAQFPAHGGYTYAANGESAGGYGYGGSVDNNYYTVSIGQQEGLPIVGGKYIVSTANRGYPEGTWYQFGRVPLPRTTGSNGSGMMPLYLSYKPVNDPFPPKVYLNGNLLDPAASPALYSIDYRRGIVRLQSGGNLNDVLGCLYHHLGEPAPGPYQIY